MLLMLILTVLWVHNTEPDLSGYRVHIVMESGQERIIDVGYTNEYTFKYEGGVTAYSIYNLESPPSEMVSLRKWAYPIYPNPSRGVFSVVHGWKERPKVYNVMGQEVGRILLSGRRKTVFQVRAGGVYMVKIGERTEKVVVIK